MKCLINGKLIRIIDSLKGEETASAPFFVHKKEYFHAVKISEL